jgi:hypothetical protein
VSPESDPPGLSFAFSISMGVRKGDTVLRDRLNHVLARRRPEIERILDQYGVPRLPLPGEAARGRDSAGAVDGAQRNTLPEATENPLRLSCRD